MAPASMPRSVVEHLAQQIGIGRGWLSQGSRYGHLCELPAPRQDELRIAARAALADRTWRDAELWARDLYAQWQYQSRTFNALTAAEQNAVVQRVANIAASLRLYLSGDIEPLTDWHRSQVQPGARTADSAKADVTNAVVDRGGYEVQ